MLSDEQKKQIVETLVNEALAWNGIDPLTMAIHLAFARGVAKGVRDAAKECDGWGTAEEAEAAILSLLDGKGAGNV